jgi:hypothetical protein
MIVSNAALSMYTERANIGVDNLHGSMAAWGLVTDATDDLN